MQIFQQAIFLFGLLIAYQMQPLFSADAGASAGANGQGELDLGDILSGNGGPLGILSGNGGPLGILSGNGGPLGILSGNGGPLGILGGATGGPLSGLSALFNLLGLLGGNPTDLLGPLTNVFKIGGTLEQLLDAVVKVLQQIVDLLKKLLNAVINIENVLPAPLKGLQLLKKALETLKSKLNLAGITVDDLCDLNTLVKKLLGKNAAAFNGVDLLKALQALTGVPIDTLLDASAVAQVLAKVGIKVDTVQAQLIGALSLVIQVTVQLRVVIGIPCPTAPGGAVSPPPAGGAALPPLGLPIGL